MARQFTGWLDDAGGQHSTQAEAEAADEKILRATADRKVKEIVYRAIDWERQKLDIDELLANAATLIVNIEALVGHQPRPLVG
jgi:hypothetical protein